MCCSARPSKLPVMAPLVEVRAHRPLRHRRRECLVNAKHEKCPLGAAVNALVFPLHPFTRRVGR